MNQVNVRNTLVKREFLGGNKMFFFSCTCPNCKAKIRAYQTYCSNCGYNYILYNELIDVGSRKKEHQKRIIDFAHKYYALGDDYFYGKNGKIEDNIKAMEYYEKSAALGFVDAIYSIGYMYLHGYGVQQDFNVAYQNLILAADYGHTAAHYYLGVMYFYGYDVEVNYDIAFEYFTIAAERGHAKAQKTLSWCYRAGEVIGQDFNKALKWIKKPAAKGDHEAEFWLGWLYQVHERNNSLAFSWFYKSAVGGYAVGQLAVAGAYTSGLGVERDVRESHYWYDTYLNNDSRGGSTQEMEDTLEQVLLLCYSDNDRREQQRVEKEKEYKKFKEAVYNTPITGDFVAFDYNGYCIHEDNPNTCKYCSRRSWNEDDACYEKGPYCRVIDY